MTGLERRSFPVAQVRALSGAGDAPGTFEAIVAVFGNVDSYGDRIVRGAFARTLKPPPDGRGLPPVVWSHQWGEPPIGATLEAEEVAEGLRIKARLLVGEGEDHATARAVYAAMKAADGNGRPPLREFSFGFTTLSSRTVTEGGEEIRELLELELFEVGPTLVGANPSTRLVGVKSANGRVPDSLARLLVARPHH